MGNTYRTGLSIKQEIASRKTAARNDMRQGLKQKSRLAPRSLKESEGIRLRGLNHCADALGAQRLLGLDTLLVNGHLLQVRQELAIGGPQGEGTVMTERGCLTAMSAFSHRELSFLAIIPLSRFLQAQHFTTKRILLQVPQLI